VQLLTVLLIDEAEETEDGSFNLYRAPCTWHEAPEIPSTISPTFFLSFELRAEELDTVQRPFVVLAGPEDVILIAAAIPFTPSHAGEFVEGAPHVHALTTTLSVDVSTVGPHELSVFTTPDGHHLGGIRFGVRLEPPA